MRHLFIINPTLAKTKDRVDTIKDNINLFFQNYPQIEYDIYVTRWCRDAVGYTRRYVTNAAELVRVHVFGGTGTLNEVVNGVICLPNVQIAAQPLGVCNGFLRYFGVDKLHLFASLRNQVFSDVISVDAFRCGNNYGISYCVLGIEAKANIDGDELIAKTHLPDDLCYTGAAMFRVLADKRLAQSYKADLDGQQLDGNYISMLIANQPCYGVDLHSAVDAHPNDGLLDLYLLKEVSKLKFLSVIQTYTSGNYHKIPNCVSHYTGQNITISSDTVIYGSIDGETFYDNSMEFELIPNAIYFVCPNGIDTRKLPRVYNRPETIIDIYKEV